MNIDNILISNKISSDDKNYRNPLLATRMITYVKSCDGETKWLYFFIEDELLKIYNKPSNKVCNNIKKEFDSKPVYKRKVLKTKLKSYGDETRNFNYKEMPKVGSTYIRLAVTLILFLKRWKLWSLSVFFKCKHIEYIAFFEGVIYI